MKKLSHPYNISLLIGMLCLLCSFCSGQKKVNPSKIVVNTNGKQIVSAPIVIKNFVGKGAAVTSQKEFYVQRSIQDYFIKFCESSISRKQLENHLSTMDESIKVVTLELELLEGEWDNCHADLENRGQSRIGSYAIIHRIIKEG